MLDILAARETEVKVHTLSNTVSELKGDKQVKVNAKALDYQMGDRQAKVKVEKVGDTSQRPD